MSARAAAPARSAAAREQLLRAAAELFAERGYQDTSVSDLAARAGMSVGSCYNQFPGKAAILLEVFREYHHRQAERTRDAISAARSADVDDPVALFVAATHAYLVGVWRERRLSEVFTTLAATEVDMPSIRAMQQEWLERNTRLLGIDDDSARSAALAAAVTGAIGGWVRGVQQCGDEDAAESYIREAVRLQKRILTAAQLG